ncbi:50S ribosomal protein L25/general stress protein Ctc [Nocardioides caldifontis]|uniref:50S ribosomal protein L25/general stress protein Ctc n=1 Tax=Nocardioides caldifontis TaxID=2588938 RepID=UPI0011DF6E72|nr:50S ribosomal protein L25/general stress protein Ctc [Nocardioides caldifontis]
MSETRLQAEPRNEFGKGAARRIRRAHKVPAVLYGHGTDPVHVTLPGHDTMMALKHGGANALLSIELEGETQLALPKQVQRHPVRGELEHVDLLIVRRGEKVTVDVPVVTVGDAAPETVVTIEHATISLEAEATHIPESVEVSVEGAEAGTQVLAKDLTLPSGTSLQVDEEALVVNVTAAVELEVETESDAVAEAGEEPESGEETVSAVAGEPGEAGEENPSA